MVRFWFALCFAMALAAPAFAGAGEDAFRRGVAAYKSGDHAAALAEFRSAADLGMPVAQFNLGLMHANGLGTPKDEAEAAKWWRKAAERGVADAQNNLGLLYEGGRGVALELTEAVRWYRAAALQERPQAQHNLGAMYANGRGIERDLVQAYMWFDLAAARHKPGGARDESIKARDSVAAQLSADERTEAERLSRDWAPADEPKVAKAAASEAKPAKAPAGEAAAKPVWTEAKARTAAAQAALKKLGYDPGPVDGVEGPRTRAAITLFQRDRNLPDTGRLSDEVSAHLSALVPAED